MATRKKQKNSIGKTIPSVIALLLVILLVYTKGLDYFNEEAKNFSTSSFAKTSVHFIDVGQGMSTLVQSGTKGVLIDAGEKEYADKVIKYIKSSGVNELEYVIASHPHTDHIGAMSKVIEEIETKNIIMPKLTAINIPTTRTYENLINTVKENKVKAIAAKYGNIYTVDNIKIEILGPIEQVKDLNNMSVVCRVTAEATTFMILADAEKQEMKTITQKNPILKSDVLLMGHHGSSTSIQETYLKNVGAKVAVISCGKNNSYGHPHKEAIDWLKKGKTEYYRTDKDGTIVVTCKATGYSIKTEKG